MTRRPPPVDYAAIAARQDTVARMTREGLTANEIAVQLGITQRTVVRDRRARGVSKAGPPPGPLTDDEIRRARELLEDGCSYPDVAETLGRGYNAIVRACPGYHLSKAEIAERSAMGRRLAAL